MKDVTVHGGSVDTTVAAPATNETPAEPAMAALVQRKIQRRALQRRAGRELQREQDVQAIADAGVQGGGGALPHADAIQKSFGRHDVSGIVAHTDEGAGRAAREIGATAFATGNHVAFDRGHADLHTAAHEAAHVVQQRAGVSLAGGVGQEGDAYERHADAVADAVVRGGSAEGLLDTMAGGGGGAGVQRKEQAEEKDARPPQASGSDPILDAGEAALAAGQADTTLDPNDIEGIHWDLKFRNAAVDSLLSHLIVDFLGEADPAPLRDILLDDSKPPRASTPQWVKRFRYKAIAVNTAGKPVAAYGAYGAKPQSDGDPAQRQRMARLATQLADAILPKTDGEKFREDFLSKVKPGTSIMSQAAIDKQNKELADSGKAGSFTTCIAFAGDKVSSAMAEKNPAAKPFRGPNGYKEVTPSGQYSLSELPPGSWKDAKTASELPRPGDMLVLNFAEKSVIGKDTPNETTVFPGYFAHVNILREIQPVNPSDPELVAAKKAQKIDSPPDGTFITIDGGGTVSTEGREFYHKADQRLDSKYGKRFLKGWFDVAVMAGAKD